jgi:putative transposase
MHAGPAVAVTVEASAALDVLPVNGGFTAAEAINAAVRAKAFDAVAVITKPLDALVGPSTRDQEDAELTGQIRAVHEECKGRYGAPQVQAELRRRGRRHSRKRVARLMRTAGIRGRAPKRWRKTTVPDPAVAARADRIRRDFTADASKINARWCGDITYVGTWEGWLYLATVIDIASRRVVGYALADHLRTELVSAALTNAIAARDPGPGVIFHAGRGCQYTSTEFAGLAKTVR